KATSIGRTLVGSQDHACTDHGVPVVEHGRLAGCDAVGGLVEPELEAVGGRGDGRRDRGRAVAELRVDAAGDGLAPEAAADVDARARESGARAGDDGVRARVGAERVERLAGGDAEAAALARGEAPE